MRIKSIISFFSGDWYHGKFSKLREGFSSFHHYVNVVDFPYWS